MFSVFPYLSVIILMYTNLANKFCPFSSSQACATVCSGPSSDHFCCRHQPRSQPRPPAEAEQRCRRGFAKRRRAPPGKPRQRHIAPPEGHGPGAPAPLRQHTCPRQAAQKCPPGSTPVPAFCAKVDTFRYTVYILTQINDSANTL